MMKLILTILTGLVAVGSVTALIAIAWFTPEVFRQEPGMQEPGMVVLFLVTSVSWVGFALGCSAVDDEATAGRLRLPWTPHVPEKPEETPE